MKKNAKWLVLGIVLAIVLLFVNQEVYKYRINMAKAKEAFQEKEYDDARLYLQRANTFLFQGEVEKYLLLVEDKKRESILTYMNITMVREKQFEEYKAWIEQEILTPVSMAFEQNGGQSGVKPKPMRDMFYQLNFKMEERRINLNKEYEEIHDHLSEYIQKNQIAYSYWEQKKPTEAEKVRQEAIKVHTEFMIEFNKYAKEYSAESVELMPHYY